MSKNPDAARSIWFSDAERALLAWKGKAPGRKTLLELDTLVSPDTLIRWLRRLVAQQWNFSIRRNPRPGVMRKIAPWIVRMAQDEPGWGYTRIQGALEGSGCERFLRCRGLDAAWADDAKMIFVGPRSLRRSIDEFMAHYHRKRNHQRLGNGLTRTETVDAANESNIHRRKRLGGLLNHYHRAAA